MNKFAFAFGIVFLLVAQFAASYDGTSVVGGWMKVTRHVSVEESSGCTSMTGACSATGAILPASIGSPGGFTSVTLAFENVGLTDRKNVAVTEGLMHVPEGAVIAYEPLPTSTDGRSATWAIGTLAQNERKAVRYNYTAKTDEKEVAGIPDVEASSAVPGVFISAPSSAKAGERIAIVAKGEANQPLSGAKITINGPDGSNQYARTDAQGSAAFVADKDGFYTYSIDGYSLAKLASTEVSKPAVPLAAAAAVPDNGIFSSLAGLLPTLAAIFVVAMVALVAYNFFAAKQEEEPYYPPQGAQQPQRPMPRPPEALGSNAGTRTESAGSPITYSQQYSFGTPAKKEAAPEAKAIDTRKLVESRMGDAGISSPAQEEEKLSEYPNHTHSDDEVERELAALEKQAREEGEIADVGDDYELDKAISELEAIREKLREKKGQMDSIERRMSAPPKRKDREDDKPGRDSDEPVASRKTASTSGKKFKFGSHGVRKK